MSVKSRLARIEANLSPEPVKSWATFLWCSDSYNAALAEAEKAAEAEGRDIKVIRLVSPELDANRRVIKKQ
jgi:hypothetical protein